MKRLSIEIECKQFAAKKLLFLNFNIFHSHVNINAHKFSHSHAGHAYYFCQ